MSSLRKTRKKLDVGEGMPLYLGPEVSGEADAFVERKYHLFRDTWKVKGQQGAICCRLRRSSVATPAHNPAEF